MRREWLVVTSLTLAVRAIAVEPQAAKPPQSALITAVTVAGDPIEPFKTEGDLWLSTWTEDDELISGWGDGRGVAPHSEWSDCGIAAFLGIPPAITAEERCFLAPTVDPAVNDKPSSLLAIDGRLVGAFHSPLGDAWIGYLAESLDGGRTWRRIGFWEEGGLKPAGGSPWTRDVRSPFRCLFFVNMGRAHELSTEPYVYALGIGTEWSWFGGVRLARAPRAELVDYAAWRYFAGLVNGTPSWSAEQADAVVLEGVNTSDQGSAMFHPGINRYLFLTSTALFETVDPWGPWSPVRSWNAAAGEQWQGGYQPGIIAKGTGANSFWFTIAGQNAPPRITYRLHLGQIVMTLATDETIAQPDPPAGPSDVLTGASATFTVSGGGSSAGHALEHQFDWSGDGGDVSPWGGATAGHAWGAHGERSVRVRSRCAAEPFVVSRWSAPSLVKVSAPRIRRALQPAR